MKDPKPFFAPLAHGAFRRFWLAAIASNLGALIQSVGAAWLMTSITSSVSMVALVQASTAMPIMLFSIVSGAIADSFDRRQVMLIAQVFMLVISAALTTCALLGWIAPWVLLTFTFLIGCGAALNTPSWQATVGDLVPREDIADAVSLNSVAVNVTRSVGPALGGVIVALGGAVAAFASNTVCYLAMIVTLVRWGERKKPSKLPREPMARAIMAGLSYVSMSPNLLKVYLRSFAFGVCAVAVLALLPVVAHRSMGGGPLTYGLMLCAFGVGAVAAAMINARLRQKFSSESIIFASFGGIAVSEAMLAISPNIVAAAPFIVIAGACWVIALSLFNTIVQLSTPRWVVGRALSFYQTSTFGGMTCGSWLWGSVAESHGIATALSISAALTTVGMLAGVVLPMPAFQSPDLDPLQNFREPKLKLDILPRSGPIAVHINYEIRDEDIEEFLSLMAWRRLVRIRDGAKAWTLNRDLENPALWMELYRTPTWADYLRHNQRRTKADANNHERLLALHQGREPLSARRWIERHAVSQEDELLHQIPVGPH